MKRTPLRGVKQPLKPFAYKRSEPRYVVTACLLHNEPTSYRTNGKVEGKDAPSRRETESEQGV